MEVDSGIFVAHHLTAWGQWVGDLMHYTAALTRGNGLWNFYSALHDYVWAMGGGSPEVAHCLSGRGHLALELVRRIASLPVVNAQWNSRRALPHRILEVGNGTPVGDFHAACGQCILDPLQCIAAMPGGSGPWNSYTFVPKFLVQ